MYIVIISILKNIINSLKFLAFFLGPGMLYHFIAKKINWKKLGQYAESNKIHHKLTRSYDDFGELLWKCQGRPVKVRICYDNPSFGPWISVGLKLNREILELKTYRPMVRPYKGWEEFTSPNRAFNYMYRTRQINSSYKEKLLKAPHIFDAIVDFYEKWIFHLSNDIGTNGLVIDGKKIMCIFGPSMVLSMFPYISPEKIEKILPHMIELAEKFDSAVQ